MATYTELATYVKDWANRDVGVLGYDLIRQCIRYAHDECYRTLRIAPLEITRSGTVTTAVESDGFLRTEDDLVEFIQLRKIASEGPRSYSPYDKKYIVAEAHSDARSFQGDSLTLYSDYAFYREGYNIYIFPKIKLDEVWELYYYRRLPEPNERFTIQEMINLEGVANTGTPEIPIYLFTEEVFDKYFETLEGDDIVQVPLVDTTAEARSAQDFADAYVVFSDSFVVPDNTYGMLKQQWLRDVNEKVLLFGALHQAFDYLDESDQSEKYKAKFEQEIFKLNKEDMDRMNSGGNINVNFYNRLI